MFRPTVSEVTQVPGAVNIVSTYRMMRNLALKSINAPLTPPQRQYLNKKIDEMLEVGVIEHVEPSQVKCVLPTVLAQKAHEGGGLT